MGVFNYKIQLLNVLEFFCNDFDEGRDVSVSFGIDFKINEHENLISCTTNYRYVQDDNDILYLRLEGIFIVSPQTLPSLTQNDEIIIPVNILQYLATICVGAARGEIHARAQLCGSNTQKLVLPPINLTECIKNDWHLPISKK